MSGDRVNLDAIEARAKEATPGPWWIDRNGAICTSGMKVPPALHPIVFDAVYDNVLDAEHIAGMDPQTVLALVAELRVAREVVEAFRLWVDHDDVDVTGPPGLVEPAVAALDAYDQHTQPPTQDPGP
jgi:hypothetical protein